MMHDIFIGSNPTIEISQCFCENRACHSLLHDPSSIFLCFVLLFFKIFSFFLDCLFMGFIYVVLWRNMFQYKKNRMLEFFYRISTYFGIFE